MLDVGTFGSKRCEIALNDILIKLKDDKINSIVCNKFNKLKTKIRKLEPLKNDREAYMFYIGLLDNHMKSSILKQKDKLPDYVFSHLMCCVHAILNEARRSVCPIIKKD